jgi:hypothetical protein
LKSTSCQFQITAFKLTRNQKYKNIYTFAS